MNRFLKKQLVQNDSKILLIVLSGVGGIQSGPNLLTELQQAHKPKLNAIARKACCGLMSASPVGTAPDPIDALSGMLGYGDLKQPTKRPETASQKTFIESFAKRYRMHGAVIADNPLVSRMARLFDLACPKVSGDSDAWLHLASEQLKSFDFCLVYFDAIAKAARQGDYYDKVKTIEKIDSSLAALQDFSFDVLAISGDYSLPTTMAHPSWHPVPVMIQASSVRNDAVQSFDELSCSHGGLGRISYDDLMVLLLAHALRLTPLHN
ncbi:MAG TPA: hypothetical protein PKN04_08180 [bacterium]|nr:hypothetical protein [bacterium]HNT65737.1 hypothetical protein [bacterium]